MTVILAARNAQRFIGLTADVKPTAPPAGSEFYETDTGITSVYDGAAWQATAGAGLSGFGSAGGIRRATKTVTFTGAANLGAIGNVPIFTVTGSVVVWYFAPVCTVTLAGATATIALGVTGSTSLFIATTTATTITTAAPIWESATPATGGLAIPSSLKDVSVVANIVGTVATAAITAGAIRFDIWYQAMSANGLIA